MEKKQMAGKNILKMESSKSEMNQSKIKITNPYNKLDGHFCFGCSDQNPIGLHLEFQIEDDTVVSFWNPSKAYQGFYQVLHGGIIATLMDEVGAWAVQLLIQTAGVTSELNVRYLKPVNTTLGALNIVAKILEIRKLLVDVQVELVSAQGTTCAEAQITYFTYPEKIAKEKLFYPGIQAFMPDSSQL